MKRILSFIMAILLAITVFPMSALAAFYSASSGEEMSNYWQEASDNEDGANFFTLTDNVDMSGHELIAFDGKIYTVTAEAGSDYSMSNVIIGAVEPEGERQGSIIYINADINGDDQTALMVSGETNVYITGDVSVTSESSSDPADLAIIAASGANVNVFGDVTSEESGIHSFGAHVGVEGDVTLLAEGQADAENYVIFATDASTVHVGGDVLSEEGGIYVSDADTEVSVDGSVSTEGQTTVYDNGSLDIGGDLTCNPTGADTGVTEAVFVYSGELTVDGDVKTPELYVSDNSTVKIGGDIKADNVSIGSYGETTDNTTVSCRNIAPPGDALFDYNCSVNASGASHTTVYGHIRGELWADTRARVDVSGNVAIIRDVADKAVVNTGLGFNHSENINFSNTYYGEDIEDPLAALCIGYTDGNKLYEQTQYLSGLLSDVSSELAEELTAGSAIISSIYQEDEYFKQTFISTYHAITADNAFIYNEAARDNLRLMKPYFVDVSMNILHESLKTVQPDGSETSRNTGKIVYDAVMSLFSECMGIYGELSAEKAAYFEGGGKTPFTVNKAREFLLEYGYFSENEPELLHACNAFVDMFHFFYDSKLADGSEMSNLLISTMAADPSFATEFIDYWIRNYDGAVRVLDNLLVDKSLDPNMFMAAYKLRTEYRDKFYGSSNMVVDKFYDVILDRVTGEFLPDNGAGDFPVEETIECLVTDELFTNEFVLIGTAITNPVHFTILLSMLGQKYSDNLITADSLVNITPKFLQTYEQAIKRVQDGDTSEEALSMVRMNFTVLVNLLESMCKTMCELGSEEQATEYRDILRKLNKLQIGKTLL